jgi:hypothetical protein
MHFHHINANPYIKRQRGRTIWQFIMMGIVEVVSSQSTINPQEAGHAGHGHH